MYTRYFTLGMGILFILAGIGGFLPFITTHAPHDAPHLHVDTNYGYLLGLYPINIIHNLVHMVFGVIGIAIYRQYKFARAYAQVLAISLAVLTIVGIVAPTGFGYIPLFGHDIWLHALEAILAGYLGFVYKD